MSSATSVYASIEKEREDAYKRPLSEIDVSDWKLHGEDRHWVYFERLRSEDPVHFHESSRAGGPFWSVTKFKDIKYVDTHHDLFSSHMNIFIHDMKDDFLLPSFMNSDPPVHDEQRRVVAPIVSPRNLGNLEPVIRERAARILDHLPVGERFDWVERVSIELTTQMLATLFDFPFEERYQLTRWSELATGGTEGGAGVGSREERRAGLFECLQYFKQLKEERARDPGKHDLITMLATGESTRNIPDMEFLANIVLLIVGGNDTTRNSISGGVFALNSFPEQYEKLRSDTTLIPNMVAEIIRWQTPLAYMRRTATEDTELGGKLIRKGDKVVMWYVSGNRDDDVFERPNDLVIDRGNARQHVSFGFGLHRCMGNRLAELQLRVLWEEIMKRFAYVEVVGPPVRAVSNFVRGYRSLPVVLHSR